MAFSPNTSATSSSRQRLSLGTTRHRLKYEHRIRIWLAALAMPALVAVAFVAHQQTHSLWIVAVLSFVLIVIWLGVTAFFFEQLIRPLQTLANVVAALREDDFSFRARGARRGDSLGDLALEINALANTLQNQRSAARDVLTLAERVMTSMQSPVLAFDASRVLRLLNPAAESSLHLPRHIGIGTAADDLSLDTLLATADEGIFLSADPLAGVSSSYVRWSVRRTTFRLHGLPHTLFVLSDIAAALREEERAAWQRLIRVLSHEINNSLTPIKSIAGSLRTRLPLSTIADPATHHDLHRGLSVIEERAASLNRFLQAYQELTRLPPPQLQPLYLLPMIEQVVHLETRLAVELLPSPALQVYADSDQLQQLLINLLRNAVDAALAVAGSTAPRVSIRWSSTSTMVVLELRDNGLGLINPGNLFVPFYTTKPEGSGIGLVLSQQIANAHKGSVSLYNNPESAGCIAEVRLPLCQDQTAFQRP